MEELQTLRICFSLSSNFLISLWLTDLLMAVAMLCFKQPLTHLRKVCRAGVKMYCSVGDQGQGAGALMTVLIGCFLPFGKFLYPFLKFPSCFSHIISRLLLQMPLDLRKSLNVLRNHSYDFGRNKLPSGHKESGEITTC